MPAVHSRTIKKFFFSNSSFSGALYWSNQSWIEEKIITESYKTWNVDICIVGLLCRRLRWGDWLGVWGQKTKVGSSSGKVLEDLERGDQLCRPQGKLEKRQSRFSKSQTGGKSKQNIHSDYLPLSKEVAHQSLKESSLHHFLCIQLWSTKAW